MPKSRAQAAEDHAPWKPPEYDQADAAAIQALVEGRAGSAQQKRAIKWIIEKACGTYDFAFRPGGAEGERDTGIALGRQFVGQQIVKLVNIKIGMLKKE